MIIMIYYNFYNNGNNKLFLLKGFRILLLYLLISVTHYKLIKYIWN